jgi:hypothetical protein
MSCFEGPKISVLKVSGQGQITLSNEAQKLHDLNAEQSLLEVTFPGCIILLPQSHLMADLKARTQLGFEPRPRTIEELKAYMNIRLQRLRSISS